MPDDDAEDAATAPVYRTEWGPLSLYSFNDEERGILRSAIFVYRKAIENAMASDLGIPDAVMATLTRRAHIAADLEARLER